jgi:predicted small lipoprotein YifL
MKRLPFTAGLALALLLSLPGCGLKKDTKAAEAEIDRFHQHWNADEFKAIYDESHSNFRNKSAEETVGTFAKVKGVWGQFKTSTKRSWGFNTNNGMTDVKLKYDSTYEHGTAVEAFVYRMTNGKAMLTKYEIMSPENAKKQEEEEQAKKK